MLTVDKQDYLPFLNWLSHETGIQWVDIDKERAQMIEQVQNRAGQAFYVGFLDHAPQSDRALSISRFLVLPVEVHNHMQLLLFRDQVKPKNLAGILPVTRVWSDNRCVSDSEVLYRHCVQDRCDIEAILLPTATYRVEAPPSTTIDMASQNTNDCAKLHDQQLDFGIVWRPNNSDVRPTLKGRD